MVITYIITGALILLSLLIQGHSSFDVLRLAGVKPDILFVSIVYFSYSFGSFYGGVTGFLSGLLHDASSNSPLGLLAFPKMLLGFIIGMYGRSILKENILTITLLLFIASLAKGFITILFCYIFHKASLSDIITLILPESFYNALIAPPIFFLYDKIFKEALSRESY